MCRYMYRFRNFSISIRGPNVLVEGRVYLPSDIP